MVQEYSSTFVVLTVLIKVELFVFQVAKMADDDNDREEGVAETLEQTLFDALHRNDLDHATFLVTNTDLDVNKTNYRNKTPLSLAVENEHVPMVVMLLESGADVNRASYSGAHCAFETPVVTACRLKHIELLEILLRSHCEIDCGPAKEGKSALQWASFHGDLEMAQLLFNAGADVNWLGPFFHTALHYGTIAEKPHMVDWLLDKGAEVEINREGRTPLHIAAAKGNLAIVKSLIKHECEVDITDSYGFTPFSLGCLRGHLDVVKYIVEYARVGTNFNMEDGLHRASECGHVEVLDYLIWKSADVNSVNSLGESALSIAVRGQPKSVDLLLKNHAIINTVDKRGYAPLQHAIIREQNDIAVTLIRHGAHLHTYCVTIESPLHISYNISNPVLIKCLIDAGCCLNKEKWFNAKVAEEKLRELDFQYNCIRYQKQLEFQKEIWRWVIGQFGKPRSLLDTSRVAIRAQLVTAVGGKGIIGPLHKLPLPAVLKQYLALSDTLWV